MSIITDINFLTTYQGTTIERNGVTYTWKDGKYQVSSSTTTQNNTNNVSRKVLVNILPSTIPQIENFSSTIEVLVDNQLWPKELITYTPYNLQISFDENYLITQRLITFKTQKGTPLKRIAIKAKVTSENDVVVVTLDNNEEIPIIGTGQNAQVQNNSSTATTNNTNNQTPTPSYTVNYNTDSSNQIVDNTIGEATGQVTQ